jgi:photosystem II stability/assembly factor-like uncharacterized protein
MKKFHILLLLFALCPTLSAFCQEYGWTDISANIPGSPDLSDVFFVSDDEGWITSSSHAEIYHTTDGGKTFEIQTTFYTCNAIHMLNENFSYAGGASGFIYKTTDGGANWNFYGTMVANLVDISFPPTGDTGYACGINGNIWSISNSGVTKMTSNINGNLYSISFPVTSEEGWVCGGDVIRHYKNNIWNGDQDYPSGGYYAIHFLDNKNGWATGDKIICTKDGFNWTAQINPSSKTLYDVFFLNTQEGWTIGSGGTILQTTNGGTGWNIVGAGLTTNSLTGVHFTSSTNGYVVGNGKTLLKYSELSGIGEEPEALLFTIFPNPVRDKFKVQSLKFQVEDAKIEVYNLNSRKLLEKQIPAGNETIEVDVSLLQSGIYFCKLITEKGNATKKLIIQK